jgi:uncharacterized protein (TIGR03067 family)
MAFEFELWPSARQVDVVGQSQGSPAREADVNGTPGEAPAGEAEVAGSRREAPDPESGIVGSLVDAIQRIVPLLNALDDPKIGMDQTEAWMQAHQALQGTWVLAESENEGQPASADRAPRISFIRDRCVLVDLLGDHRGPVEADFELDADTPRRFMDLIVTAADSSYRLRCRYEIEGDTLRLTLAAPSEERPSDVTTEDSSAGTAYTFTRDNSDDNPGPLAPLDLGVPLDFDPLPD